MIYLAPIQGFTDFVYRDAFNTVFKGIDKYFIPYISLKSNEISPKYIQEIIPSNNKQNYVVPQVLVKDAPELIYLGKVFKDYGYSEINLNLGCPYPMVTNRGKGAGLLPYPEKIHEIFSGFYNNSEIKLSVKFRAGLINKEEVEKVIPVFNEFPLTEIIFHARVASQLYKGSVDDNVFWWVEQNTNKPLVYNGDIYTLSDFNKKKQLFPSVTNQMLGRGILKNVFLPDELNGNIILKKTKSEKLKDFHALVFEGYSKQLDNKGNVLNKMKQFWSYFSFNFENQQKFLKRIKKIKNYGNYSAEVKSIFSVTDF